jgi:hypothetical protein
MENTFQIAIELKIDIIIVNNNPSTHPIFFRFSRITSEQQRQLTFPLE